MLRRPVSSESARDAPLIDQRWDPQRTWDDAVEAFLATLTRPATRHSYRVGLREARRLQPNLDLAALNLRHVSQWRERVMSSPGLAESSRQHRIAAMNSFIRWTHSQGMHDLVLASGGRQPRPVRRGDVERLSEGPWASGVRAFS